MWEGRVLDMTVKNTKKRYVLDLRDAFYADLFGGERWSLGYVAGLPLTPS